VEMPELLSQWKIKTYGEQGLIALPIEWLVVFWWMQIIRTEALMNQKVRLHR
jgi:hypothetical protein